MELSRQTSREHEISLGSFLMRGLKLQHRAGTMVQRVTAASVKPADLSANPGLPVVEEKGNFLNISSAYHRRALVRVLMHTHEQTNEINSAVKAQWK